MEKLVYVLWKPEGTTEPAFAEALLARAPDLAKGGAQRLRIDVTDDAVAAGGGVRVGRMDPPKSAAVTFWLDEADRRGPVDAVLAEVAGRRAGYLVVESVPLENTAHVAPLGERTPGFNFVTCIEPKAGLSYDEFVERWHTEHRRVAFETQDSFGYVRNEIVRALTPDAPPWAAVVEEHFPIEALTDPKVWYDARGSEERFQTNLKRMVESCVAFLAMDRVEAHPMSEYVFER